MTGHPPCDCFAALARSSLGQSGRVDRDACGQLVEKSTDILNAPYARSAELYWLRCALCSDPAVPGGWAYRDQALHSAPPVPDDVANSEEARFRQRWPVYRYILSRSRALLKWKIGHRSRFKFNNHCIHSGASKATCQFVKGSLSGRRAELRLLHPFVPDEAAPAFLIARHRGHGCAIGRRGRSVRDTP
jgi:hypothetical protein